MNLYTFSGNKYKELNQKPFLLEKDLQQLFEDNLSEITGLEFVKSEFKIKNKRIDTLAFNNVSNAFVIIEYKRDKHYSVIDQGIAYLTLMLEHKAEFILEYYARYKKTLKKKDIRWHKSLVLFVSQEFTENQLRAVNFKYYPIVLLEVKYFDNGILLVNEIRKTTSLEHYKPVFKKENTAAESENWHKTPLWLTIRKLGS